MLNKLILTILTAVLLTVAGATTSWAGPGNGNGGGGGDSSSSLTELEEEHLLFMREEEKLARDSYRQLYDTYGSLIFDNIAASEQNHMDALKVLLDKYKLEDPILDEGMFRLPELQELFNMLMDKGAIDLNNALEVGAWIEETDIVDIQHAINDTESEHDDLISTYESLMCGSRNHLRAFISQIKSVGYLEFYEPLGEEYGGLSEEELWLIADGDMETDCGRNVEDDDDGRKRKGKR